MFCVAIIIGSIERSGFKIKECIVKQIRRYIRLIYPGSIQDQTMQLHQSKQLPLNNAMDASSAMRT